MVDFPDPSNFASANSHSACLSTACLDKHLAGTGLVGAPTSPPTPARRSGVTSRPQSTGLIATPYHALVPSFGEWV